MDRDRDGGGEGGEDGEGGKVGIGMGVVKVRYG